MKRRNFIKTGLAGGLGISLLPNLSFSSDLFLSEIERCKKDPIYFIEKYCMRHDPYKGLVNFKLHKFQKKVIENLMTSKYNLYNKSRQVGMTTILVAFSLWKTLFFENINILFVSVNIDNAKHASNIYKKMFNNLPNKLKIVHDIENYKYFIKFENESSIGFMSARENGYLGCGESVDYLFFDEYAYFNNPKNVYIAKYPLILSKDGNLTISSTPNGISNHFHELWTDEKYKYWGNKNSFKIMEITRHLYYIESMF